jgi:hypothetical protein
MWRGHVYGGAGDSLHFGKPVIYHGVWGTGLFQTLYQPAAAHLATLPATLEWHFMALLCGLMAFAWPRFGLVALAMILLSVLVALMRAAQAPLAPKYEGVHSRLLVAILCYLQPLRRSWSRYRTRIVPAQVPKHLRIMERTKEWQTLSPGFRWMKDQQTAYWDEKWREHTELLRRATARFGRYGWPLRVDPGWDNWDLEVFCGPWTVLRVYSTVEVHAQGKRLMRLRYVLRPNLYLWLIGSTGALITVVASRLRGSHSIVTAVGFTLLLLLAWWYGSGLASRAAGVIDTEARAMGLIRIGLNGRKKDEG